MKKLIYISTCAAVMALIAAGCGLVADPGQTSAAADALKGRGHGGDDGGEVEVEHEDGGEVDNDNDGGENEANEDGGEIEHHGDGGSHHGH